MQEMKSKHLAGNEPKHKNVTLFKKGTIHKFASFLNYASGLTPSLMTLTLINTPPIIETTYRM